MRRHTVVTTCVLAFVIGCGSAGDGGESYDDDGGRSEVPNLSELDSGLVGPDSCALLVQRTCGPSSTECAEAASCEAALLLQTYEPARCGAALSTPETFVQCTDDACTKLVEKTCGASPEPVSACASEPGCALSKDIFDDSRDQEATAQTRDDARAACAAGLEDGIVFPSCSAP